MSPKIPEGVTPEMLEQLVGSPGTVVSQNEVGAEPTTHTATTTTSIGIRAQKGVRPRVSGNSSHDVTGERISRPSSSFAKKLADGDEKIKAEARERLAEIESRKEETDVDKILARLNYLERTVKSQSKLIKDLKNNSN